MIKKKYEHSIPNYCVLSHRDQRRYFRHYSNRYYFLLIPYLEQLQTTICQTTEIKKIKHSFNHCIYLLYKRLSLNSNS